MLTWPKVVRAGAQVGAEFLARHYPVRTVLLPSPTWPSHNKIFPLAGVTDVRSYRYFKPSTRGLDYEVQPVAELAGPAGRVSCGIFAGCATASLF